MRRAACQHVRGLISTRAFVWAVVAMCSWGVGAQTEAGLYSVNASNIIVLRRGHWFSAPAVADILQELALEGDLPSSGSLEIHPNHSTHLTGAWAELNVTEVRTFSV